MSSTLIPVVVFVGLTVVLALAWWAVLRTSPVEGGRGRKRTRRSDPGHGSMEIDSGGCDG
ncbi:hypothetical protein [Mycolicibacterium sp.]|uniref:hypothetical protein n=1 Tax=Mycolicibacterium sp. TaxID=2320850 RepID=UPI003D0F2F37